MFNQSKTRFLFYNQNVNCQYDIILTWVWTFHYFILWDFPNVKKTCVNLKSNCFRAFNVRLCNALYACASELLSNVLIFLGQRAIKYSWFSSEIRISTSGNTKQLLCCKSKRGFAYKAQTNRHRLNFMVPSQFICDASVTILIRSLHL